VTKIPQTTKVIVPDIDSVFGRFWWKCQDNPSGIFSLIIKRKK
jgi:hypothetical protein